MRLILCGEGAILTREAPKREEGARGTGAGRAALALFAASR
jgi:hypothetical protein